ncbi:hypothetical protein J437_LFUL001451 [Ladona fulva]|uniref:Ribonuclease P/MRP protein subunit POP5 n=1 Tax=Ladona fulva TaxID=123851 RepID=A0A8K0JXW7_LADFU|nr:hypothetical protein J437_LFUL001451 [Ladona fulva]
MVRYKNRYIAVRVDPVDASEHAHYRLNSSDLYNAVYDKIQQLHGDFGVAATKVGLCAKYCNEMTRVAFIRARHGPHTIVATTLPFINEIAHKRVVIRTLHCGATMLQCHKFLKKYQRKELERTWMIMKPTERIKLEEEIMNIGLTSFKNKSRRN